MNLVERRVGAQGDDAAMLERSLPVATGAAVRMVVVRLRLVGIGETGLRLSVVERVGEGVAQHPLLRRAARVEEAEVEDDGEGALALGLRLADVQLRVDDRGDDEPQDRHAGERRCKSPAKPSHDSIP